MKARIMADAPIYKAIAGNKGLRWLSRSYPTGKAGVSPLSNFEGIMEKIKLFRAITWVISILLLIGLAEHVLIAVNMKRSFWAGAFIGCGILYLMGWIFFIQWWSDLVNAWVEVHWICPDFAPDVRNLAAKFHRREYKGIQDLNFLSGTGQESELGTVPEHVTSRFRSEIRSRISEILQSPDASGLKYHVKGDFEQYQRLGIYQRDEKVDNIYRHMRTILNQDAALATGAAAQSGDILG